MLPTRFLSCCSQNLQKSTFDYTVPLFFFPKWVTEVGVYFLLPRVHVEFHLMGQRTPRGSLWLQSDTLGDLGHPLHSGACPAQCREALILKIFSEEYLCINNFSCMDQSMQTTNVFSLNIFNITQFNTYSKSGFLPWQVENIFTSKQTVFSSHAFWQLKLSARKVWSFLDAQFSEHDVKRA